MLVKNNWLLKLLSGLLVLFSACRQTCVQTPHEVIKYMDDARSGLIKHITVGSAHYTVQLVTPQYMAIKEGEASGRSANTALTKRRTDELAGTLYFLIRIAVPAGPTTSDARISYYATAAAADLHLQTERDTLQPSTFHFEDNQGLTAYNTLIAGFDVSGKPFERLSLVFNDRAANNYFIRAAFDTSSIANIPVLDFKQVKHS